MRLRRTVDLYPIFWKNVQMIEYLVLSKKGKRKKGNGHYFTTVVKTVRSIKLQIPFSPFKILKATDFGNVP